MRNPEVSVIMPTYNRSDFILDAVHSVKNQSFQDLELIIVDDGSTDETADLVRDYLDQRCGYHKLTHEGNISRLRNHGLKISKGNFIAYLDSDDIWESSKIMKQVNVMHDHSEVGIVFTKSKIFTSVAREVNFLQQPTFSCKQVSFRDVLANHVSVYPSSILFRKECLEKTGNHYETFRWNDLGFITRVIAHCNGLIITDELTGIRKHDDNISTKIRSEGVGFRDMIFTADLLYEEGLLSEFERDQTKFHFLERMGSMLRDERNFKSASETFKRALEIKPMSIKTNLKYAFSSVQAFLKK